MEVTSDSKKKENVFLLILICLFLGIMYVHTLIPSLGPLPENVPVVFLRRQNVLIAGFVLGLFQLLISVEIVLSVRSSGFLYSLGINLFNMIFLVLSYIIKKENTALPGLGISAAAILVSTIISRQYRRIELDIVRLHDLAHTDRLTGLPNRVSAIEQIKSCISGANKVPEFTLAIFDIDNFKLVNDSLGHHIGDLCLSEMVYNLRKFINDKNFLARIGGDELLLIIPESESEADIETYVMKVCDIISRPFHYKEQDLKLTASVGIVRYPKDSDDAASLLQQLDMALYRAKAHGKNKVTFFDEKMQTNLERKIDIERRLAEAVEKKELYIEYQPQFKIPEKRLRGFEVLARWSSPTLGEVAPLDFIPLAEENGLIVSLGNWILREACSQYMKIYPDYELPPMLSVNVSVVQLRDPDFIKNVEKIIKETKMDTDYLEFEITESVFIQSPEFARQVLLDVKKLGIKIALDDFGTGYSSLNYLRTLPFDVVKIDKSFIDAIGNVPDEKNIVKSIIDMSHQLGLKVISEGIEEYVQLEYLVKNHCDYIQGNLLSRPLPVYALI